MDNKNIYNKLLNIQQKLNVPKEQTNAFGKYKYRSLEDILEAIKPLLKEEKTVLIIDDEIVNIEERFYIKATASLVCTETKENIRTSAYAREDQQKKGMDLSQLTGSTSSYARKYALNALFCIDDTKDSDATNKHDNEPALNKTATKPSKKESKPKASNSTSYKCDECSNPIKANKGRTIEETVDIRRKAFDGKLLCEDCINK